MLQKSKMADIFKLCIVVCVSRAHSTVIEFKSGYIYGIDLES